MKKVFWVVAYVLSFLIAVGALGYVGFTKSIERIESTPKYADLSLPDRSVPLHDSQKPTIAVVLGNTATEATDFLGPYAMFSASGVYNVYAVASSRKLRTLAGGLDVVPHYTFEELAARLPDGPDIVVVPAMSNAGSLANAPVLVWIRQQAQQKKTLFAWCEGAEVLAASGVIDGKDVTTHWASIDRYAQTYTVVHWRRGERYIDSGSLITTAGLTSGIDATLHFLETRKSAAIAARVAHAFHIPKSPFVSDPHMSQYSFEATDSVFVLNLAFGWPRPRTGLTLYNGVDEFDLSAAIDVYEATDSLYTIAATTSVVSRYGLQLVPRWYPKTVPRLDRVLLDGDRSSRFAYHAAIEEYSRDHDMRTVAFAAKRLEIRSPLNLSGPAWPLRQTAVLVLSGFAGIGVLAGLTFYMFRKPRTDWIRRRTS